MLRRVRPLRANPTCAALQLGAGTPLKGIATRSTSRRSNNPIRDSAFRYLANTDASKARVPPQETLSHTSSYCMPAATSPGGLGLVKAW